ncbi:ABC transporter ATP-binding protein [Caenimonas aquaedulcis]|uniref:ABC transporter ATP-binding protein n=1 Tax=Caenimonas aquaedulcis TaxID=2793270 RepID=A0A931ME69_9BURK|nr:ABC transporter ATP-binding protein [Caenimonas aquaedulcis]MBG9386597.1 ABC transporter ATP-binding protein [Caenimonas aquaedulcis]
MAPAIEARGIGVTFRGGGRAIQALDAIDLAVAPGEFVTVLGASGSGKSTLLRVVADLVAPTRGTIEVLGGSPAQARQRRAMGFAFQDAALLPWRTALQNVMLPLQVGSGAARAGTRTPQDLLALVGLAHRGDALPAELSGGERQRVSLARALVGSPDILLMDEPFGALDELVRDRLNEELLRVWRDTGCTIVFVTHSIQEAAFLGSRVIVMHTGPQGGCESVAVDLPRARTLAIRETGDFLRITSRLRHALEAGTVAA